MVSLIVLSSKPQLTAVVLVRTVQWHLEDNLSNFVDSSALGNRYLIPCMNFLHSLRSNALSDLVATTINHISRSRPAAAGSL